MRFRNIQKRIIEFARKFCFKFFFNYKIQRFGSDYGGWSIVSNKINKNSIIYSFGIGVDTSFDELLIENFGCKIFAFDPTPDSINYVKYNLYTKSFIFHPYGLSNTNKKLKFFAPLDSTHISYSSIPINQSDEKFIYAQFHTIDKICKKLNHKHIDLLKLDIEGDEYDVINQILNSKLRPTQLLIEFHPSKKQLDQHQCILFRKRILKAGYTMFSGSFETSECSFIFNP